MPAFSVGKISAVVERDELSCVAVALDGTEAPLDFLQVLSIQDAKGPSPGKRNLSRLMRVFPLGELINRELKNQMRITPRMTQYHPILRN